MILLDIRNLTVEINISNDWVTVVDKFNIQMHPGEVRGLIGESGAGKSIIARAVMGLLPSNWRMRADRLQFQGQDLLAMSLSQRRLYMGKQVSLIFQDPASYMDPLQTVYRQLEESVTDERIRNARFWQRKRVTRNLISAYLHKVGIKDVDTVLESYPSELSDGLCQKITIAMALANSPKLLIADHPTSSMDVVNKVQIYKLLMRLNKVQNVSILHISNDMGMTVNWTDKLTILYAGQAMESGLTPQLLSRPMHPYTRALVESYQRLGETGFITNLPGSMPTIQHPPIGCRLGPRCPQAQKQCIQTPVTQFLRNRTYRCHFPLNLKESHDSACAASKKPE